MRQWLFVWFVIGVCASSMAKEVSHNSERNFGRESSQLPLQQIHVDGLLQISQSQKDAVTIVENMKDEANGIVPNEEEPVVETPQLSRSRISSGKAGLSSADAVQLGLAGKYLKQYRKVFYGGLLIAIGGQVLSYMSLGQEGDSLVVKNPGIAVAGGLISLAGSLVMYVGPYYVGKAGEILERMTLRAEVSRSKECAVKIGYTF